MLLFLSVYGFCVMGSIRTIFAFDKLKIAWGTPLLVTFILFIAFIQRYSLLSSRLIALMLHAIGY